MSLFYAVIYTITYVNTSLINILPSNKHLVHVVYIVHVHICESISSHDVDNYMKNTLITCIMVIQIVLYTGSSCTDKLTYIFLKGTPFNEQFMLLGFEFIYINKRDILTRQKFHTICTAACVRCDSCTACRLCLWGPFTEVISSVHHVQYLCWYRFLMEYVTSSRDVV